MKVKASELIGAALDWAVAKIEGRDFEAAESFLEFYDEGGMRYSIEWAMGGPLIEREEISLDRVTSALWIATRIEGSSVSESDGPTPLVAAMRCYVASQLGDEVDVPDELKGE